MKLPLPLFQPAVLVSALIFFTAQAGQAQALYSSPGGNRNDFSGTVGGTITIGATPALVTHLGYFDDGADGLVQPHAVAIFKAADSSLVISNLVPAGTSGYLTNGYRYVGLPVPVLLAANTAYKLQAEIFANDGDGWPDSSVPATWTPNFVGATPINSRFAGWGFNAGFGQPNYVIYDSTDNNQIYGAPNMAVIPIGPATAIIQPANLVTQYATLSATLSAYVNGAAPVTVQWYKAPGISLPGKTNTTLTLSALTLADAGDYYLIASNGSSMQSGNITLTVLPDQPVSITQQPTNTTVFQGFPASFQVTAAGTVPISYQWRRNGIAIPGATASTYSFTAVLADHLAIYSCVASNFANGGSHTATSTGATLSVNANASTPAQLLFDVAGRTDLTLRADFAGVVGGSLTVGATDALVTHLGFYCSNPSVGLQGWHHVGIFTPGGALLASVQVPPGPGPQMANDYAWVALDSPLLLTNGGSYVIGAEVDTTDLWVDKLNPAWNPYFVGATAPATRVNMWTTAPWPTIPANPGDANYIYLAGNLAFGAGSAPGVAVVGSTNLSRYVGFDLTTQTYAYGQAPLRAQWFKSPATPVPGQTNAVLTLANLALSDAGIYYVRLTNSAGTAQGPDINLTVLPVTKPFITQQPAPVTAYVHQPASFTVVADGTPTLTYQWSRGGTVIPGATNSTLVLTDITTNHAGTYRVVISNLQGSVTNDTAAVLTVLTPAPGGYLAAALEARPILYYRFGETDPAQPAANFGTWGSSFNGTYDSSSAGLVSFGNGPQPPAFPTFEATNSAVILQGLSGFQSDMTIPALNFDTNVETTIAMWVNSYSPQSDRASLILNRAPNSFAGLRLDPAGTMLQYAWGNAQFSYVSGLYLTNYNQWTFVALVVQPDRGTLYLNDGNGMLSATNIAPHAPSTFATPSQVGVDPAVATRLFYGALDEVMVFRRALSPQEIIDLHDGVFVAPVSLGITSAGGKLILNWPNGTLQASGDVNGVYTNVPTASSPYTNTPALGKLFFRVKVR